MDTSADGTAVPGLKIILCALLALMLAAGTGCESSGGGGGGDDGKDFGDRDPSKCAVIGDSIAAGYGAAGAPWPARLGAMLERSVDNHAFSGASSGDAVAVLDGVLARDAGYVIVSIGANDAIHGIGEERVVGNLSALISRIREAKAVPVFGNITIMTEEHEIFNGHAERLSAAIDDLCSREKVILVNLRRTVSADMLQEDGLHPSDEGQEAIAKAFYGKLRGRVK